MVTIAKQALPTFKKQAPPLSKMAGTLSAQLTKYVDRVCVALLVLLILDVWLGIMVRYVISVPITFTEEAARYLMIWTALLAVSSCISRREHIGVLFIFDMLPEKLKRPMLILLDAIGLAFFLVLFYYGLSFTSEGTDRFTMIFGINKGIPFAIVPIAAALASIQLILVAIRDQGAASVEPGMQDIEGEE